MSTQGITIRHWLPIITFCPVNNLPDVIYVSVGFTVEDDQVVPELYEVRRKIRRLAAWRKCYMEDIAKIIKAAFPEAQMVEVRLAFDRHVVTMF